MPWLIVTAHSSLYINADPEIVFDEIYCYEEFKVICDQTCQRIDQTGCGFFWIEKEGRQIGAVGVALGRTCPHCREPVLMLS